MKKTKLDNLIIQAYRDLVCFADNGDNNILEKLSDWICTMLDDDQEKVLYFSLPIWNYLVDQWDSDFPMCTSKANDYNFSDKRGWYKNYRYYEGPNVQKTQFDQFVNKSKLGNNGFSFVEFVTQNATNIGPVFTIKFEALKKGRVNFKKDKESLVLFNNKANYCEIEEYRTAFVNETYGFLVSDVKQLDDSQRKDLESMYRFLCSYQSSYASKLKCIYLITSRIFEDKNRNISSGGLILVCKEELDPSKLSLLSVVVNLCYREKGGKNWEQKCRKEAIKSAVSAIMTRNMSHNLGSHYMYYTKAYLEQLANSVNDIAPDIRGAAKVLGYVQARMDYLATVISNDKYPYGAVNFKSQIYDELTIDDFSHRHFLGDKNKRTTNFLLTNLIYSENFTRPDVREDDKIVFNGNKLFLYIKYSLDGHKFNNFTGTWHEISIDWVDNEVEKAQKNNELPLPTITSEQDTKNMLSSLNIALPGGSMSCHAFFNIVENFIRNSAKYLRSDVNEKDGLICTIAIQPNTDKKFVDIIIYDNKKNANKIVDIQNETSLYDQILKKLSSLVIIDEQNKISKEDKGFKEMLFSAIWMRAYIFGDKTYADVVAIINQAIRGNEKLGLIEKYGFSLVKVIEHSDGNISSFTRNQKCEDDANLGLKITLPVYNQIDHFSLSSDRTKDINSMLNMMADIVEVDEDFLQSEFNHVFTHSLCDKTGQYNTNLEKYRAVIKQRFPDIDKYSMSFGEKSAQELNYKQTEEKDCKYCIYFGRHIDTKRKSSEFEGYAYADTISGGNFTITMLDLFKNGIQNGLYKDDDAEIFSLKIKESALTRITIVDERLYNSTNENEYPWLSLKNIRILNYDEESDQINNKSLSSIFIGNNFGDYKNYSHFLSIHLGLIEKILKNSCYVNSIIDQKLGTDYTKEPNLLSFERVKQFMDLLKEFFGENNSCILYIAVHSGRGNYSKELEGPLCTYPFISLSALENAYKNSKYQLSQLFYNTVFVGKGLANEQNSSSS